MSLRRSHDGPEQSDRRSQSSSDASSDWEMVSWKEETQQSGQGKFPDINNDRVDEIIELLSDSETAEDRADDDDSDWEESEVADLTQDLELQELRYVSPPTPDSMAGIGYWMSPGNSPTPMQNATQDKERKERKKRIQERKAKETVLIHTAIICTIATVLHIMWSNRE